MTFAGMPAATEYGGMLFVTTEQAPIWAPLPIVTAGSIVTFAPMQASSSTIIVVSVLSSPVHIVL